MKKLFFIGSVGLLMVQIGLAQENYKDVTGKYEFTCTEGYPVKIYSEKESTFKKKPKNIILMIGDGMGVTQVYAGITANGGVLNLQNMKQIGFSQTQSANNYITDSAAGGTAISTGTRTNNGAIGVDVNGNPVPTILELSEQNGKATGLVSTSAITHATPASFIAHVASRSSYEDIALDFLKTDIDVFIGGGKSHFHTRKDGRDLLEDLKNRAYQVFDQLADARHVASGKLAVLTAGEHNESMPKRGTMLEESTSLAVQVLNQNSKKGFFLMVEGSQIDWGGHQNDAAYVVQEMLDFDRAIGKALEFAVRDRETLVIVTADHETGGMSLTGGSIEKGMVKAHFASSDHTAVMVPVFAFGPGAEAFQGIYKNTDLFIKMKALFGF